MYPAHDKNHQHWQAIGLYKHFHTEFTVLLNRPVDFNVYLDFNILQNSQSHNVEIINEVHGYFFFLTFTRPRICFYFEKTVNETDLRASHRQ